MTDELNYELVDKFQKIQARRLIGLASYVIYIYDFLLTYSEVQRLIQPSKRGVVKFCYYFNRVIVPIGLTVQTWQMSGLSGPLSDTFCKQWFAVAGYMGTISLGLSNMILLLWVHAIYGRPKKLLFGLLAFFFATYATILVIATQRMSVLIDQKMYSPPPFTCLINPTRPTLPSNRIVPIDAGFDVLIFCMTLYKSIEQARTVKSISNSPILSTLYRDGLGYFFVIIILKLGNLFAWSLGNKPISLFGMEFFLGLTTALISRMLLNLRVAVANDHCGQGVLDQYELRPRARSGSTYGRA